MKRNTVLPKLVIYKNEQHLYRHTFKLLKFLFPSATITENTIAFQDSKHKGISISVSSGSLYPFLSESFRKEHPTFFKNGFIKFEKTNTPFQWTGSTGKGYMSPWDRDTFEDTEMGMEQKAYYFIVIIQVLLHYLTTEESL
ncbi:hypothetical protein GCM10011416_01000 [Polaribacter pacificus]|uniref:Uncharacterized protein n=1 Tax=Polaribacter pacificus TaxID=1775173 RepID=A0A917HRX9_9FLAO|nr:hypothetical protein [Polaribacter pacificus]GGG88546.1 hypothetical protein GCM10011416_01000 [Polaribacter pacificus]